MTDTQAISEKQQQQESRPLLWTQTTLGKRRIRRARLSFGLAAFISALVLIPLIISGVLQNRNDLGNLCLVLHDDFDGDSLDTSIWQHEVSVGGFGTSSFEWDTADPANTVVEDGILYIVPTLTTDVLSEDQILDGYTVNLMATGECTQADEKACVVTSNRTAGTIINPARSARIDTGNSTAIKYGRVEVVARLPTGQWLWPAIWMLPQNTSTYGLWPRGGEIDIMESGGRLPSVPGDLLSVNAVQSSIHRGSAWDAVIHSTGYGRSWPEWWNEGFHKYVLDWDERGITFWIDKPSNIVEKFKFDKRTTWQQLTDKVGALSVSGNFYDNPWINSEHPTIAPFDQPFYLIMNVAVGGNYFWGLPDQPFTIDSAHPATDFWAGRAEWESSWPQDFRRRGMAVDSVKMWQKC